jgi:hypothetical protein
MARPTPGPAGLQGLVALALPVCPQAEATAVVVTATAGGVAWPLLASVGTASASEAATFGCKVGLLPEGTHHVTADNSYDVDDFRKGIEGDEGGRRAGRRLVCPENPRNGTGQKPGPAQKRRQRRRLLAGRRGRRICRRGRRVEPFHEGRARVFELDRGWHRGPGNKRTQVLGAIFADQVPLRYNHQRGASDGQVKAIVDRL